MSVTMAVTSSIKEKVGERLEKLGYTLVEVTWDDRGEPRLLEEVDCLFFSLDFFKAVPSIRTKMEMLAEVGLTYIKVGQSATTLSGGEAQRVKLSKELSKRSTGKTVYILDEPTTGLHFHDVAKLLEVLHRLTDQGNTVIVIEHNLEVIKTADWIIDIGPEGGSGGGRVMAEGTPEDVAQTTNGHTSRYLRDQLG